MPDEQNTPTESQPPGSPNKVTFGLGEGAESYEVQPQPYPRLFRQLSGFGKELQDLGEMSTDDLQGIVLALGGRVHEFLRIFIPNLMAEHRFAGYPTRAAMDAGEWDEQAEEAAPTIPQVRHAIAVCFRVNELTDIGGLLGKLLGPKVKGEVQNLVAAEMSSFISRGSKTSPDTNGPEPSSPDRPSAESGDSGATGGERSSGLPSRVPSGSPSLISASS